MKFAYVQPTKQIQDNIVKFRGLNKTLSVGDGEFSGMLNMTGDYYPVLSPRRSRMRRHTFAKCNGIYGKDKLLWVDGTELYYGGVLVDGVTLQDNEKRFVGMGVYVLILPDKKAYNTVTGEVTELENSVTTSGTVMVTVSDGLVTIENTGIDTGFKKYDAVTISGATNDALNGDFVIDDVQENVIVVAALLESGYTQEEAVTISRLMPDMDYVTECNNRVWGCSSATNEIHACKLGDPTNWKAYEDISTDSYTATVGSDGPFTGAATHQGNVYIFKEGSILQIMGMTPSSFQVDEMPGRGVQKGCGKSIALVNETMVYKAVSGYVAYSGGMPNDISYAMGMEEYRNAVGGAAGTKYYVSMQDANDEYGLYVMDMRTGMWHKEDGTQATWFARCKSDLFFVAGNILWSVSQGEAAEEYEGVEEGYVPAGEIPAHVDPLPWYAETGDMMWLEMNKKRIAKVAVKLDVGVGSSFALSIQYDGGAWQQVLSVAAAGVRKTMTIPMIPRRCDRFRIKMAGAGDVKIYALSKTYEKGSDA